MKTKKFFYVFFISVFIFFSCSDNPDTVNTSTASGLSGQWEFTNTPLNVYYDTTVIKGYRDSDFPVESSTNNEVYLYQSGNQLLGQAGLFQLRGTVTDSIRISIYEPVEGRYGQDTAMLKSSEMTLALNQFGFLEGSGRITLDWDTAGVIYDTYRISARKVSNIIPGDFNNFTSSINPVEVICDKVTSKLSLLIGYITDNYFRPMGNCWGHKVRGGYYVFGHIAPGNLQAIYTQTVFFPYEWSFCKAKKYHFKLEYNSVINKLEELEEMVGYYPHWLQNVGFNNLGEFSTQAESFNQQYGNFALIVGLSLLTNEISIYVINEVGDPNAHTHPFVVTVSNKIRIHFRGLHSASGRNITDKLHLKRSDFFLCNTPVIFCYLFGTVNVKLD